MRPDVLLFLVPLVLILMMTMQGRRRRRAVMTAQNRLTPGAVVMTGAGMFGTVVAVEGDQVTLETGPGQTSTWLRQAVVRVITPAAEESGVTGDGGSLDVRDEAVSDNPRPVESADSPVGGVAEEDQPRRD